MASGWKFTPLKQRTPHVHINTEHRSAGAAGSSAPKHATQTNGHRDLPGGTKPRCTDGKAQKRGYDRPTPAHGPRTSRGVIQPILSEKAYLRPRRAQPTPRVTRAIEIRCRPPRPAPENGALAGALSRPQGADGARVAEKGRRLLAAPTLHLALQRTQSASGGFSAASGDIRRAARTISAHELSVSVPMSWQSRSRSCTGYHLRRVCSRLYGSARI